MSIENELGQYVHALVGSQEKFAEGAEKIIDSMVSLTDRLERWIHVAGSVTDQMERYADLCNELVETNRLDSFIGKLESYFGSGAGLEYEN